MEYRGGIGDLFALFVFVFVFGVVVFDSDFWNIGAGDGVGLGVSMSWELSASLSLIGSKRFWKFMSIFPACLPCHENVAMRDIKIVIKKRN